MAESRSVARYSQPSSPVWESEAQEVKLLASSLIIVLNYGRRQAKQTASVRGASASKRRSAGSCCGRRRRRSS